MKILTITLFLNLPFTLFGQDKVIGRYRDYFGSRIQLNPDSTFEYTWHFDLSASWTKGTWTVNKDTVHFHMVPKYDTITDKNKDGTYAEKVILSVDQTPERLTQEEVASMGLPSGGQNFIPYPEKLVYKKGRLYGVKNGRIIKKKQKGFWTKKKWNPWFFKSDD